MIEIPLIFWTLALLVNAPIAVAFAVFKLTSL